MLTYEASGWGETVVLQHGFFGGAAYWRPVAAALSRDYRVIAPNLAGFSGSAHTPAPTDIAGHVAAIIQLLDSLDVDRFSFVGHSMGGMIAQLLASRHADRLNKLVLYGTACSGALPGRFESFARTGERLFEDGLEATRHRVSATWFKAGDSHPHFATCEEAGRGVTMEAARNTIIAMAGWEFADQLATIKAPTLVICGDSDHACNVEEALRLWSGIGDTRLCVVPDCAHNVHLEMTDVFNRILLDFLTDEVK